MIGMDIAEEVRRTVNDARTSLVNITDHLGLSFTVAILDAFSVFTYFTLLGLFFGRIDEEATTLMEFFIEIQGGATQEELLSIIPSQEALNSILGSMFISASWFFLALCVAWILIQGVAWHLTYRISEHEHGPTLKNYMRRFAKSSAVLGGAGYIAGCIFLVLMIIPIYSRVIGGSVVLVNILSLASYLYLILLAVLAPTIISIVYSAIFSKKSFKAYRKEISSILLSRRSIHFICLTLVAYLALRIAGMIQGAFHVLPSETMVVWIDPSIIIGFILVFGVTLLYRLVMLRTFERKVHGK